MYDDFLSWGENIWFTLAFSQFNLFCPRTSTDCFHAVHIPWWLGNGSQSRHPDCPLQKNFSSRSGPIGPLIVIAISNDALQVFKIIISLGNCWFASLHSSISFTAAHGIVGRAEFVCDAGATHQSFIAWFAAANCGPPSLVIQYGGPQYASKNY